MLAFSARVVAKRLFSLCIGMVVSPPHCDRQKAMGIVRRRITGKYRRAILRRCLNRLPHLSRLGVAAGVEGTRFHARAFRSEIVPSGLNVVMQFFCRVDPLGILSIKATHLPAISRIPLRRICAITATIGFVPLLSGVADLFVLRLRDVFEIGRRGRFPCDWLTTLRRRRLGAGVPGGLPCFPLIAGSITSVFAIVIFIKGVA